MDALCCILNYNCNENANYLYNEFNKYCEAHVIDSDSDNPYPYFENVGNFYYTNLFNKSIEKFKQGNYTNLIIMTSDVKISNDAISYICNIANTDMKNVGVVGLQTDITSRSCWNKYENNLPKIREVNYVEGFFMVIHKDVVLNHSIIPLDVNKYGVVIDQYTCRITRKLNKKIIIDSTYLIHHPNSRGYNYAEAHKYDNKFMKWANKQLEKINYL